MKMKPNLRLPVVGAALATLTLAACEPPPVDTVQRGYRGVGMELVINPDERARSVAENMPPDIIPQIADDDGPRAGDIYQNVQVLGDLSVGQFTRVMASITEWVSPEAGCAYCHEGNNFASEAPYTKRVSRVMFAMTQRANEDWGSKHVAPTGVTCYTCHRGQPVPEYVWAEDPGGPHAKGLARAEQNIAGKATVAYASLPYDPLTPFLSQDYDIRVASDTALPNGNRTSIKQTEWTYGLMMHFSDSLNANCTYCHNSRAWSDWEQSSPARLKAWHAIRMVREMNNAYIDSTADWLPDSRKGALGDPLKVNCKTCHQGAYKPMYGAQMIDQFPSLSKKTGVAVDMHKQGG
ncbi:photosynthetic reaction center cytochrome PufC [Chromatocurvus halotolerans]|uniref:Photosynthetic reaction center cytochrome c subunit n=1 Tax=Chromatocurvus halotolerans TaxID=1132028 RepID=A0A4R2L0H7_9GAMM|nr:photosynthetic reaction center cytochrome PufC [Chromatocurvus halotolerans]TCO77186.1 photosynthetic reaction center cytochrome c subunit [Chromatocurvus halotolerans]